MTSRNTAIAAGLFAALLVSPLTAFANGCNGVVSQFEWGCAAWDNNNGPQFPHYRGAAPAKPVAVPQSSLPARQAPLVAAGGGNFVGNNGSAFVGNNGGALVSNAGGTIISQDGAGRHGGGH